MTHKEFTASISVHEDWVNTDKDIHYTTVALVEAEDIENAEKKVFDWYSKLDTDFITHKVTIHKVLPKIH
jgi:hypothetical protein